MVHCKYIIIMHCIQQYSVLSKTFIIILSRCHSLFAFSRVETWIWARLRQFFLIFIELLTFEMPLNQAKANFHAHMCRYIALFWLPNFFMQIAYNPFNLPLYALHRVLWSVVNFKVCSIDQIRASIIYMLNLWDTLYHT